MLVKIETVFEELNHRSDEVQFEDSIFFQIGEIRRDRIVGLNQMRILIAEFNLLDQDQGVGSNYQAGKGVSFEVLLVKCLHRHLPQLVDLRANLQRRVVLIIRYRLLGPFSQKIMNQDQQFQSNQTFTFILLRVSVNDVVNLLNLILLLIALGNDRTIVLEKRCLFVVFHKSSDPSLSLSCHLIIDPFDLIQNACLGNNCILL